MYVCLCVYIKLANHTIYVYVIADLYLQDLASNVYISLRHIPFPFLHLPFFSLFPFPSILFRVLHFPSRCATLNPSLYCLPPSPPPPLSPLSHLFPWPVRPLLSLGDDVLTPSQHVMKEKENRSRNISNNETPGRKFVEGI